MPRTFYDPTPDASRSVTVNRSVTRVRLEMPDRMSVPADKQEVMKNLFDTAADIRKTAALP